MQIKLKQHCTSVSVTSWCCCTCWSWCCTDNYPMWDQTLCDANTITASIFLLEAQWAHNVETTTYQHQCNAMMFLWHCFDVVSRLLPAGGMLFGLIFFVIVTHHLPQKKRSCFGTLINKCFSVWTDGVVQALHTACFQGNHEM